MLLAGVHRAAADRYVVLAQVAQRSSEASYEEHPVLDEGGGAISTALAELVADTAAVLADSVWHSYWSRLLARRKLKTLREREQELRADPDEDDIEWARPRL